MVRFIFILLFVISNLLRGLVLFSNVRYAVFFKDFMAYFMNFVLLVFFFVVLFMKKEIDAQLQNFVLIYEFLWLKISNVHTIH